jgi:hypothetical protein
MNPVRFVPVLVAAAGVVAGCATLSGCDATRKQECDQFLSAMKPLTQGTPSIDVVDTADRTISAIQFQDQPLREYAFSTKTTLHTLSESIRLQTGPAPPDGSDEIVKAKLNEARGEDDDVTRYCAE